MCDKCFGMFSLIIDKRVVLGLAAVTALVGCGVEEFENPNDASTDRSRDSGVVGERSDAGGGSRDAGVVAPTGDAGAGAGEWVTPDAGAGTGAACTGKPGALRGKVETSVTVDGTKRTFIYYVPTSVEANRAVPLVISPHGFTMSGEAMYTLTKFKELADREGFVAVFPDGNAIPWNVGADISGAGAWVNNTSVNDQGFVDAIIKLVEADQCIDKKHVFVSGFSMGGYFSNEIGCVRNDIAGIGPHSGGSHDLSKCTGSIKPVIIFHGDADTLITYNENGVLARDRWVARNGCGAEVESRKVNGGTCDYNRGCPAHAQVALCHFDDMGHAWAGGNGTLNSDPNRENAAELAWKFWKDYAW